MMIDIIVLMHIKTGWFAVESIESGKLKPVTKDVFFIADIELKQGWNEYNYSLPVYVD